jgi:hypothetical protein
MNIVVRQQKTCLKYPFRVHFYEQLPDEELNLEDFEKFALDRLKRRPTLAIRLTKRISY